MPVWSKGDHYESGKYTATSDPHELTGDGWHTRCCKRPNGRFKAHEVTQKRDFVDSPEYEKTSTETSIQQSGHTRECSSNSISHLPTSSVEAGQNSKVNDWAKPAKFFKRASKPADFYEGYQKLDDGPPRMHWFNPINPYEFHGPLLNTSLTPTPEESESDIEAHYYNLAVEERKLLSSHDSIQQPCEAFPGFTNEQGNAVNQRLDMDPTWELLGHPMTHSPVSGPTTEPLAEAIPLVQNNQSLYSQLDEADDRSLPGFGHYHNSQKALSSSNIPSIVKQPPPPSAQYVAPNATYTMQAAVSDASPASVQANATQLQATRQINPQITHPSTISFMHPYVDIPMVSHGAQQFSSLAPRTGPAAVIQEQRRGKRKNASEMNVSEQKKRKTFSESRSRSAKKSPSATTLATSSPSSRALTPLFKKLDGSTMAPETYRPVPLAHLAGVIGREIRHGSRLPVQSRRGSQQSIVLYKSGNQELEHHNERIDRVGDAGGVTMNANGHSTQRASSHDQHNYESHHPRTCEGDYSHQIPVSQLHGLTNQIIADRKLLRPVPPSSKQRGLTPDGRANNDNLEHIRQQRLAKFASIVHESRIEEQQASQCEGDSQWLSSLSPTMNQVQGSANNSIIHIYEDFTPDIDDYASEYVQPHQRAASIPDSEIHRYDSAVSAHSGEHSTADRSKRQRKIDQERRHVMSHDDGQAPSAKVGGQAQHDTYTAHIEDDSGNPAVASFVQPGSEDQSPYGKEVPRRDGHRSQPCKVRRSTKRPLGAKHARRVSSISPQSTRSRLIRPLRRPSGTITNSALDHGGLPSMAAEIQSKYKNHEWLAKTGATSDIPDATVNSNGKRQAGDIDSRLKNRPTKRSVAEAERQPEPHGTSHGGQSQPAEQELYDRLHALLPYADTGLLDQIHSDIHDLSQMGELFDKIQSLSKATMPELGEIVCENIKAAYRQIHNNHEAATAAPAMTEEYASANNSNRKAPAKKARDQNQASYPDYSSATEDSDTECPQVPGDESESRCNSAQHSSSRRKEMRRSNGPAKNILGIKRNPRGIGIEVPKYKATPRDAKSKKIKIPKTLTKGAKTVYSQRQGENQIDITLPVFCGV